MKTLIILLLIPALAFGQTIRKHRFDSIAPSGVVVKSERHKQYKDSAFTYSWMDSCINPDGIKVKCKKTRFLTKSEAKQRHLK
jgi:hypothetical protein